MLRLPPATYPILLALALLAPLQPAALAQLPDELPDRPPVPAGRFNLFPIARVEIERTDNLFSRPDGPRRIPSTVASVSPGVVVELPFSHSYARLGYAYRARTYSTSEIGDSSSHYWSADVSIVASNGAYLRLRDDFQRGVLDTQLLNGGELTFEGQRFQNNDFRLETGHERTGRRTLGLVIDWSRTRFLGEARAQFYDVDSRDAGLSGRHHLGRRSWLLWDALVGRASYRDPTGSSLDLDPRDSEQTSVWGGWRLEFSPLFWLQTRVGYRRETFSSPRSSEFRGGLYDISFLKTSSDGPTIRLALRRNVFPSAYLDNDYYINDNVTFGIANSARSRLALGARVGYTNGDYPESSVRRRDRTWDLEAWAGFRVNDWMEWRIYVDEARRRSTQGALEYDTLRVGIALLVGL